MADPAMGALIIGCVMFKSDVSAVWIIIMFVVAAVETEAGFILLLQVVDYY